jgi:hypothetical protein
MPHIAPPVVHTENRGEVKDSTVKLCESLTARMEKAHYVYRKALDVAEKLDDVVDAHSDAFTPLNRNAVTAASLLMIAALRAAEIA